ncbi:diaminobutyrate--2-oxoglutarate transaminase family protein [Actinacidiphila sp. ITFR-21]|uniref:diaminobutyrate--2-oxoglutarate transaminase family protein n=1 Tax=Actinacidiphila sp. ITFR-21 TaxID=3075199 RepID=UPI00288A1364|nr:diaminobutyrate--2-oxoglutarate transaminase family protein [Streptomyces sp. ITFR-21]WNI14321.1 diaminobutyrate--2-oxoglutarate transaminase family protein [Streptomyces sp. ITFR-21]
MTSYGAPAVRTAVPGPRSQEYLARQEDAESNARSYPRRLPLAVARAQGSYIEDVDGNVFLDFLTGAGVLSLGHNHPVVADAVRRQLGDLVHGLDLPTPAKEDFTARQLAMLPGGMRERMKMHFCGPTGANGVEAAIKLCKIATGRSEIISFQGGFHGSTAGAMAVTGNTETKSQVGGAMPGVHFFPYSFCAHCPLGLTPDSCTTNCATYLERVLTDANGGITLPAAVIMEMVQGEGGVVPATMEFARQVREVTRRLGIPLIVDEVQTGCGRTGTWYAFEQYGIEPDVVVASKALSGIGLPVAVILYDRALDVWEPGAHIGTFRGNQLAFAAGVAALDVVRDEGLLENVRIRGEQLGKHFTALRERNRWISDIRGMGLMWGAELADPDRPAGPEARAAATAAARAVQSAALRLGLICEVGGRDDIVVRLLPPLNVTAEQIDFAADILERAFAEATR